MTALDTPLLLLCRSRRFEEWTDGVARPVIASTGLLASGAAAASAAPTNRNWADRAPYVTKGGSAKGADATGADFSAFSGDAQHGITTGHLPGSSANVELIGKLAPTSPFGPLVEGQIADVAVFKDFAS